MHKGELALGNAQKWVKSALGSGKDPVRAMVWDLRCERIYKSSLMGLMN